MEADEIILLKQTMPELLEEMVGDWLTPEVTKCTGLDHRDIIHTVILAATDTETFKRRFPEFKRVATSGCLCSGGWVQIFQYLLNVQEQGTHVVELYGRLHYLRRLFMMRMCRQDQYDYTYVTGSRSD